MYLLQLQQAFGPWLAAHPGCAGMLLNLYVAVQQPDESKRCPLVIWRFLSTEEKSRMGHNLSYQSGEFVEEQGQCLNSAFAALKEHGHVPEVDGSPWFGPRFVSRAVVPRKKYGSSTRVPGLKFLQCEAAPQHKQSS